MIKKDINQRRSTQIDSSTIDGNVEFVHLVQLYFHVTSVNSVFVSDKVINNYDNFRIKSLSYSEISAILCSVFSVLTFFSLILENMSTNVRNFVFLCIFDTSDVVYNWSISLFPPIVLDHLFGYTRLC